MRNKTIMNLRVLLFVLICAGLISAGIIYGGIGGAGEIDLNEILAQRMAKAGWPEHLIIRALGTPQYPAFDWDTGKLIDGEQLLLTPDLSAGAILRVAYVDDSCCLSTATILFNYNNHKQTKEGP
jgi:hypothetical protein